METDQLFGAILLTLICILGAMGLWYLGLRRNLLAAKQAAVMLAIAPVIGIGLQVAGSMGVFRPTEFRDGAAGPGRGEGSILRKGPFPVNRPHVTHEIELTAKILGGNPPTGPVHVRFVVQSPKGETVLQGEQDLAPAPRLRWVPLRARFVPEEEGEYSLAIDIPNPVGSVDIMIREISR